MMDTVYAVGHIDKNFGGRQNGVQNQDGALTSCVTLVHLLKVSEPQFPHL